MGALDASWVEDLPSRRVLIMGLARTGRAVAAALVRRGATVVGTDLTEPAGLAEEIPPEVALELGGHKEKTFRRSDLLIVSPGIPATNRYIAIAIASGAEVITEIELAYRLSAAPIIAVTGTNGKTTTTAMLGEVLGEAGFRAPVGGNIGNPLISLVENDGESADFLVSEVSSFQLEWAPTLRPKVAVITNVTPDHLDRHPDLEDYVALKARILANQKKRDAKVLNADDPLTARYLTSGAQTAFAFSRKIAPERGTFVEGGEVFIVDDGCRNRICAVADLSVKGVHNLENFLAVCAAAHCLGVTPKAMERLARRFRGLPHRMETVGRIRGVQWVNDSKGTNVGATSRSIESIEGRVLLIAGGTDKGSDLSPLAEPVKERVRRMYLIGDAAERFARFFEGLVPLERAGRLEEAMRRCADEAKEGETVLLSPACSSFDQFRDYEHRGDVFCGAVRALEKEEIPC